MSQGYQIRNQQAIHFVTFTVIGWVNVFTKDPYRILVLDSLRYCQTNKGLVVHAWVIMSNHVHFIISCKSGYSLSDCIRDFKKFTSSAIIREITYSSFENRKEWLLPIFQAAAQKNVRNRYYQLWYQHNHPVELSSNRMKQQRLNYLHNNPVKAGVVSRPEDYVYSSAFAYSGGEDDRIKLEFL
ncbi:MAG: transposase [Flavobacteriales bacterium]|nr:transposase [Bacteroidota bacterium]MCB9240739.1 transposase [Flavobacteriales bacterium]